MPTAGKVFLDISMSLDGFITDVERPLGEGGERLHEWVYGLSSWRKRHGLAGGRSDIDAELLDETFKTAGAVVMGRRMFDVGEGPWGVTDGIESALKRAKAVAGDKDVLVAGGANIVQQYIKAGLLDVIQIHLVPILLGEGIRLFDQMGAADIELETTWVIDSPGVTHLRYHVVKQRRRI